MFNKTLIDNNVLFNLFCKEYSHIKTFHTGDLYYDVRNFKEIHKELSVLSKNEIKKMFKSHCNELIYEYTCLIKQMEKYPKVLDTLIKDSKKEIENLEYLKEEIQKI